MNVSAALIETAPVSESSFKSSLNVVSIFAIVLKIFIPQCVA